MNSWRFPSISPLICVLAPAFGVGELAAYGQADRTESANKRAQPRAEHVSMATTAEALPRQAGGAYMRPQFEREGLIAALEDLGPAVTFYNDKSPRAGRAEKSYKSTAAAEAFAYKGDYESGYAVFTNFGPSTGSLFPGTVIADEFIMGNGFDVATDQLSGYEFKIFRSSLDPLNGATLATYHFELWDGDPFHVADTSGGGYAVAKIPGTECTWTDVPGPIKAMLHCDLPVPISIPHQRVWGVMTADDTCRTAWMISSQSPEIGNINMGSEDLFEIQSDYDGQFSGAGTCCDGSGACEVTTAPCIMGNGNPDTAGRGMCSDGDAESAHIGGFGGPCTGGPDDFCANLVFNAFAPTDFTVTLQPVSSSGPATISGNEITLSTGGQQVWFDVMFENWDTPVKTWQAQIDPSGYTSGLWGTLTPYNPPCSSDADCEVLMGSSASKCNDPSYPPGGCLPAYSEFSGDDTLMLDTCTVLIPSPQFTWGCGAFISPPADDPGGPHPGGQMVLDVSPDAKGTFTIGWNAVNTWMKDENHTAIPLIGLVPGKVTVELGQCCVFRGMPVGFCVDVTVAECTELHGDFTPGLTCDDGCPIDCATIPLPVREETTVPNTGYGTRNRYLSFSPDGSGTQPVLEAIRVDFYVDEVRETMWVGEPTLVSEASGESGSSTSRNFVAAPLQCTPHYTVWSNYSSVHAYGESVVPGKNYWITVEGCVDAIADWFITDTSSWGDIVSVCQDGSCGSPDGDADFDDISAVVDKFRNLAGAPQKSRADIAPEVPDFIVDFVDIPAVVDAFRGLPYPYTPPANPCP